MKKFALLILLTVFAFTLLTGCSTKAHINPERITESRQILDDIAGTYESSKLLFESAELLAEDSSDKEAIKLLNQDLKNRFDKLALNAAKHHQELLKDRDEKK